MRCKTSLWPHYLSSLSPLSLPPKPYSNSHSGFSFACPLSLSLHFSLSLLSIPILVYVPCFKDEQTEDGAFISDARDRSEDKSQEVLGDIIRDVFPGVVGCFGVFQPRTPSLRLPSQD